MAVKSKRALDMFAKGPLDPVGRKNAAQFWINSFSASNQSAVLVETENQNIQQNVKNSCLVIGK